MSLEQDPSRSASEQQPCQDLLSLPQSVLAQVAQLSSRSRGHPLLRLSRGGRDTVLSNLKSITLEPHSLLAGSAGVHNIHNEPEPMARLLHRACCQAPVGLEVSITLYGSPSDNPDYISTLLQPGISCGGWHKVHRLQVAGARAGVHLVPQAFPALRYLHLHSAQLGEGALFSMLGTLPSPTLTSLVLNKCSINDSALERTAAALGGLPSLRSLQVDQSDTMMRLAAQVTGLTSLVIDQSTAARDQQLVMLATRNAQLQKLVISGSYLQGLAAGHLQHLLINCPALTRVDLFHRSINQGGLDALLTYGTRITHLTLSSISFTASRADVPCNWKILHLDQPSLQQLAYLPLSSVQELTMGRISPINTLQLWLHPEAAISQQLTLLSQAASNLAACPACVKHSLKGVVLTGYSTILTPQQRVQLFEALAPLRAIHVERLSIYSPLELGSPEVEALAHSLGDSIVYLNFLGCTLTASCWLPLAQRFPHLQELTINSDVNTSVADLSSFLGILRQSRPDSFTLSISRGTLGNTLYAQLEAHIAAAQLQNIRLLPL